MVNGHVVNIPSYSLKPGDKIELKPKSKANTTITSMIRPKNTRITWVDFNEKEMVGVYIANPEREAVPENIKEQLIVELYSK
jgi:small subunit ribosomal protein S4